MTVTIILVILDVICAVLWGIQAAMAEDKTGKILYILCTACWVFCAILNSIKLVGMLQ